MGDGNGLLYAYTMPAFRPTPLVNAAFRATPRAAINRPASQAHVGSMYVPCGGVRDSGLTCGSSTQYVFKYVPTVLVP